MACLQSVFREAPQVACLSLSLCARVGSKSILGRPGRLSELFHPEVRRGSAEAPFHPSPALSPWFNLARRPVESKFEQKISALHSVPQRGVNGLFSILRFRTHSCVASSFIIFRTASRHRSACSFPTQPYARGSGQTGTVVVSGQCRTPVTMQGDPETFAPRLRSPRGA